MRQVRDWKTLRKNREEYWQQKGTSWWVRLIRLCSKNRFQEEEEGEKDSDEAEDAKDISEKKNDTSTNNDSSKIMTKEKVKEFVDEIFRFIRVCPAGQFHLRVRMLGALSVILKEYSVSYSMSSNSTENADHTATSNNHYAQIANILHHLYKYCVRWVFAVDKSLEAARNQADKEIKDLCKIVRWDLSNFHAMRESVKRSHTQLTKIVRRFDACLQEMTDHILSQALSRHTEKCVAVGDVELVVAVGENTTNTSISQCFFWRMILKNLSHSQNALPTLQRSQKIISLSVSGTMPSSGTPQK